MEMKSTLQSLYELRNEKRIGVRFSDERGKLRRLCYGELIEESRRFAGGLLRSGVQPGEPVILVVTDPESAIVAILGCMMVSCPPTPIYPPLSLAGVPAFLDFVRHVAERSGASFVVAGGQAYTFLGNVSHEVSSVRGVEKFESILSKAPAIDFSAKEENPIAFLQFTSGSTSVPKGVIVTHAGLAANLWMIRESSHMDGTSCVVTWLPVYHDMGLIGTVLNAITLPCELVVLPPILFLKKPRLWLESISEFRGTHTAAPNFAYGLCVKRVANPEGLDLSSMTTFICGAEPVLPKTMDAFVKHYQSVGLHPGAMVPAYGLAEATLAVAFSPHMRGLATDVIDLEMLSAGMAGEARSEQTTVRIASCGIPMPELRLRITSEEGRVLPDRNIGEIQVQGPTVSPGYIGDPEASRAYQTNDGWLRTGDLGYIADGELYVCGRIKDTIIIRGKKFHAHDLESIASEVSGVRTGNVVAFALQKEPGESLVVVAETRTESRSHQIAKEIRTHLAASIGITPDDVLVVPAGTLPKTSSGKLKRSETRSLYQQGVLAARPGKLAAGYAAIRSGLGFLKARLKGSQ